MCSIYITNPSSPVPPSHHNPYSSRQSVATMGIDLLLTCPGNLMEVRQRISDLLKMLSTYPSENLEGENHEGLTWSMLIQIATIQINGKISSFEDNKSEIYCGARVLTDYIREMIERCRRSWR
ncbi:unnamed protein product [Linum tenue]|uniref:Uncharacterized protein n=1 Tax=Linum tenue TaxID=586396 RepID=A0AAV0KNJ0_9ROSI|nr:unnamed protein product [Linum tenue]